MKFLYFCGSEVFLILSKVQISLLLFPCYLFLGFRIEEHYHNFQLFLHTVQRLTFSLWFLSAALRNAPQLQMSKSEYVLGWNGLMFGGINSCLVKWTHVWFVLQKRRKHSNCQRQHLRLAIPVINTFSRIPVWVAMFLFEMILILLKPHIFQAKVDIINRFFLFFIWLRS